MKDGVLLINKPAGFTSFDVVAKLRGMLKTKKIGHGGTLDPNVTGVLPVFIGRATKAIDLAPDTDKSYTATIKLGVETNTQDIWGEVTCESSPEKDIDKIKQTVLSFKGEQNQLPPMFSAIKVNGVRLYDLAREGLNIERQTRKITVYDITFEGKTQNQDEYKFSVSCSKGTYVRTICADIGIKLGCGATMTSLVRTSALGFKLSDCVTLEEVQKAVDEGRVDELITSIDSVFESFPPIFLSEENEKPYLNGVSIPAKRVGGVIADANYELVKTLQYRVYTHDGKFVGIGKVFTPEAVFKSVKMFYNNF